MWAVAVAVVVVVVVVGVVVLLVVAVVVFCWCCCLCGCCCCCHVTLRIPPSRDARIWLESANFVHVGTILVLGVRYRMVRTHVFSQHYCTHTHTHTQCQHMPRMKVNCQLVQHTTLRERERERETLWTCIVVWRGNTATCSKVCVCVSVCARVSNKKCEHFELRRKSWERHTHREVNKIESAQLNAQ